MLRLLNVLAIAGLVGTAIYAYSIKYETIFRGEKIVQLRQKIRAQEDSIGMLKAEWEHVSRPERIDALADQFLDVQEPMLKQIIPIEALPNKAAADPVPPTDMSNTLRNPHAAGQTTPAN